MAITAPRYRYGDARPVKLPWKLNYAINIGDLCYIDTADTVTPPDLSATVYPVKPASSLSLSNAIADPSGGPTVAAVSASNVGPGFTVAGAGFKVAYTYVTANGLESGPSPLSSAMNTSGDAIAVTGVTVPAGVVQVNWYVTTDGGGAGTLQLVDWSPYGAGVTLGGPPPSDAPAPPAASSLSALALTQVAFCKLFAGCSAQYYDGTAITSTTLPYGVKDGYVRIDTSGFFDFACASATFNAGDLVGVALNGGGTALDPQTVIAVSRKAQAIGRVAQDGTSVTTVRVELFGSKFILSHQSFDQNFNGDLR